MRGKEPEEAKKWLERMSDGKHLVFGISKSPEFSNLVETLALAGLNVIKSERGLVLCNFVVPERLINEEGNLSAGAMAVLMDDVGAAAIMSDLGFIKASVNFEISYFSTVKINEEVEIEGNVIMHQGKLSAVVVYIRKKQSGEMIAIGRQWMRSIQNIQSNL